MKTLYITILCLITFSITYSQDITATLSGNTSEEGFSVVNAQGDTVFRITGEGNVGIGTTKPTNILEIFGGNDNGVRKSIQMNAGNAFQSDSGGSITLNAGFGFNEKGGDINLYGGPSYGYGGNINLISGWSGAASYTSGNINIKTSGTNNGTTGAITISTCDAGQVAGDISLLAGLGEVGGSVSISAGNGSYNAGDVSISAGNGDNGGGNIVLTPGVFQQSGNDGLVIVNGSGTYSGTWTQSSDERFKENIQPIVNAIDKINQLQGVSYNWKMNEFPEKHFEDGTQLGLIAQDVEKILPELVRNDTEGYKTIAYQNMVAVLVEAIKEQQKHIEILSGRIEMLEKQHSENVEVSSINR